MNRNIFVSHSSEFFHLTEYFADFLASRGLKPIVVELVPNEGRLWSVNEKVEYLMKICDSAIIIATPDVIQDGNHVPRMDVSYELGRLRDKKTIVLKERTTVLPKSLDPIYTLFELSNPDGCLEQLDKELESIFGGEGIERKPFLLRTPTDLRQPISTLQEKQIRESGDENLLLNACIFYVTEVYAQMVYKRFIPPESLRVLFENARNTMKANRAFCDQIEGSKIGGEVRALLGLEGKRNEVSSVWPAGGAFSAFAIVNNAPVGALLTGSTDDLIFVINFSRMTTDHQTRSPAVDSNGFAQGKESWNPIAIYIPRGFRVPGASPFVSTVSNGPMRILVQRASRHDPYGPGWTVVYIFAEAPPRKAAEFNRTSLFNPPEFGPYKESQYVRIRGITAPSVAGKYFFKMAIVNRLVFDKIQSEGILTASMDEALSLIPVESWPVLLVKGEVTPGVISGTIRNGDKNHPLYGQPIQRPGRVFARMTMRLNPYTGHPRPDLPLVDAIDYFDSTARGRYELQGLAPGIYDLYASAAGFPQTFIQHAITVLRGQSQHLDSYLQSGAVVCGNVFSKDQFGDTPWPENALVKVEFYDSPTLNHVPDPSAMLVSWSGGIDKNHAMRRPPDAGPPQDWFVQGGTKNPFHFEFGIKGEYGAPRDLDGMVPQVYATWINGLTPGRYYARVWIHGYNQSAADGSTFQEYSFDVKPNQWDGEVTLSINLRLRAADER